MLVGQPELNEVLARPELRQLRQRIVLRHQLRPFDEKDLGAYIDERLTLAGYTGKGIFKRSALKEMFDVTGGVPRVVNSVCDSALLAGYARGKTLLGSDMIREVARELQLSGERASSRRRGRKRSADPEQEAPLAAASRAALRVARGWRRYTRRSGGRRRSASAGRVTTRRRPFRSTRRRCRRRPSRSASRSRSR